MKKIMLLFFLSIGSLSLATEISDLQVKLDLSLVKDHLELTLDGLCRWDENVFLTGNKSEYYTEIFCRENGYSYKFSTWLTYGDEKTFRSEGYAISEGSKWFCVIEGQVDVEAMSSGLSCAQVSLKTQKGSL